MTLKIYWDLVQGTPEWLEARRGIVTASTVGQLITPKTVKPASNPGSRALTAKLAAERITGFVDDDHQSWAMLRGTLDEPVARGIYAEHWSPVTECGFMADDRFGFPIGYSPDSLVGDDGLLEIKSRTPARQLQTVLAGRVPDEHMAQVQCGLLVSGREWCDYVSFSGGMRLYVLRVYVESDWQDAIVEAVSAFETAAAQMEENYRAAVGGMPMTERQTYDIEMSV